MEEEKYYGEITDHQYYTQQRNKTKGNKGSKMYKDAISLVYMISDVGWKSSEYIAKHTHIYIYILAPLACYVLVSSPPGCIEVSDKYYK